MPTRTPITPGLAAASLGEHALIGFTAPQLVALASHVRLSPRETDIFVLRLADLNAKEIGARLGLSPGYVNVTLGRIAVRLNARGGLAELRRRTRELLFVMANGGDSRGGGGRSTALPSVTPLPRHRPSSSRSFARCLRRNGSARRLAPERSRAGSSSPGCGRGSPAGGMDRH